MSVVNIIPTILNIFNLTTDPLSLSIPSQEVVDSSSVVIYTRIPYVVNSMYALIVEPILIGLGVMPP